MRAKRLPILLGSLLLTAALSLPAAGQTAVSPNTDQSKVSPLTPTRNEYMRHALTRFNDWAQKVGNLNLHIMQGRARMTGEAKGNVDKAWNGLKLAWGNLGAAKDEEWVGARDAFEAASANMQSVWDSSGAE